MYSYFPGEFSSNISGHQCCDICAKSCRCGQESCSEPGMSLESNADETCTIKTLSDVEDFVEVWRKEHSRGILAAIHRIFGDVDEDEIKTPECEDEEMDEHAQEWANIRDDSELCNLLNDSDLQHVDVHMEEIDVSGNEQRNMSSMIGNLFKSF